MWLCQIAKNAYYTHQKKSRRARPADEALLGQVADPAPPPEEAADTRDRADLAGYDDAGQVASWARAGVEWAVSAGLLAGRTSEDGALLLSPGEPVTRAEFAAVLQTLCESVLP